MHLNAELTKSVETTKAGLTKTGDEFRAVLGQVVPRQHAAYHAMWAAVSQYFSALQRFETGEYPELDLKEAIKACEVARGQALLADPEDEAKFGAFWQEATYIRETAEKRLDTPDGVRAVWIANGVQLGKKYLELREVFDYSLLLSN